MSLVSNRTILSVAELNAEVNHLLTQGFPLLWVEGEISNLVQPASGHLYFSLKDKKSQIRCALFRNRGLKLKIKPKNGMKVLVRGRVGLYEPRGDYQLIAEHMENVGAGQLQKEYELLKQRLDKVGLFDESHKQELPEYPKRIAVITSPTGAAIRDILQVLKRRSPQTPILIYPVAVQGEASKLEIEAAIRQANADKKCDVIILARGGGSLEDLWSFNEETIAKAIYHSKIPIISGIGHEIDFTIADFVSDLRAPTPSAAAELITDDKKQLLTDIIQHQLWLKQYISHQIDQRQLRLDWLTSRLLQQQPSKQITQKIQRVDELASRLNKYIDDQINQRKVRFENLNKLLFRNKPDKKITQNKQQLIQVRKQLNQAIEFKIQKSRSRFQIGMATLDSVSPLRVLDRGYAIVKDSKSKKAITSIKDFTEKQKIEITLKDGDISALITCR